MAGQKFQALKGMSDILPDEIRLWHHIESRARRFLASRGYREIRTPALERTELFSRSIGEASDIVHKEMYTFEDRGKRSLTLRPELTAGVVRAAIEHNLLRGGAPKYLYYLGPMFRAERPQAGRRRQFHQLGVEILNAGGSEHDVALILLANGLLRYLGVSEFKVKVNNLGTPEERKAYERALKAYFAPKEKELCEDCRFRLGKNVLRILDCKVESCRPVIQDAPPIALAGSDKVFNESVAALGKAGVPIEVDRRMVRGLDYYNNLVFEVTAGGLGAQDAVAAGGRYDRLVGELGGPDSRALGFALGMERLLASAGADGERLRQAMGARTVYVALPDKIEPAHTRWSDRALEIEAETGYRLEVGRIGRPLRDHLKAANEICARYMLIFGRDELAHDQVTVKDLAGGTQCRIDDGELTRYFLEIEMKAPEAKRAC